MKATKIAVVVVAALMCTFAWAQYGRHGQMMGRQGQMGQGGHMMGQGGGMMMGPGGRWMMGPRMMGRMGQTETRDIPGGAVHMAYRPSSPMTGQMHFMLWVDDENGRRDYDADVSAYLYPQDNVNNGRGVQIVSMGAGHAMGYVDVEDAGSYELAVRVMRPNREDARVYFPLQVQQRTGDQYMAGPGGRMMPQHGGPMGMQRGGMRGGQWMMGPMSQMMDRNIPGGQVMMAYRPSPLTPGQAMFSIFVNDESGMREMSATVTGYVYPEGNPSEGRSLQMAPMGGGHSMGTVMIPYAGAYELAVRVKRTDMEDAVVYFPLQVQGQ